MSQTMTAEPDFEAIPFAKIAATREDGTFDHDLFLSLVNDTPLDELREQRFRAQREAASRSLTALEIAYARERRLDLSHFGYSNRAPRRVSFVRRAGRAVRRVARAMRVGATASGSSPPSDGDSSRHAARGELGAYGLALLVYVALWIVQRVAS